MNATRMVNSTQALAATPLREGVWSPATRRLHWPPCCLGLDHQFSWMRTGCGASWWSQRTMMCWV